MKNRKLPENEQRHSRREFRQFAVAYYRRPIHDRTGDSVLTQQEDVRRWAKANGIVIVKEFIG